MITTQTIMEMRLATLNAPTDAGSANTPSTRTGTAASETWINSTTPSGNAVRQSAGNVCASVDIDSRPLKTSRRMATSPIPVSVEIIIAAAMASSKRVDAARPKPQSRQRQQRPQRVLHDLRRHSAVEAGQHAPGHHHQGLRDNRGSRKRQRRTPSSGCLKT